LSRSDAITEHLLLKKAKMKSWRYLDENAVAAGVKCAIHLTAIDVGERNRAKSAEGASFMRQVMYKKLQERTT
jgi:hypothetical protein